MASLINTENVENTNNQKPSKKGVFKALKFEFQQIKSRWGNQIKLMWNRPPPPWPARVLRIIPQTKDAEMYDVDELRIRLIIKGPNMEDLPIEVEVAQKTLPKKLQVAISNNMLEKWKEELANELGLPEHLRSGWQVEKMLAYAESNFGSFLRLVPEFLEAYFGSNDDGVTIRRFAIIEPVNEDINAKEKEERLEKERPKTAARQSF